MRKLPPHMYETMHRMRSEGATISEIARAIGRHRGTVHKCLTAREKPQEGSIWHSEDPWPTQVEWARRRWG